MERASGACELCGAAKNLTAVAVAPHTDLTLETGLVVCATCEGQLSTGAELDADHWKALQDSAWSQVPAVVVTCWRLLGRLDAPWATSLLEQLYLPEEVLAWAQDTGTGQAGEAPTLDSNGAVLSEGDSVTLIKDLNVKGAGFTAKRGTMVRRIRLTDDPALIEGKVNGTQIVLKTCFLKRA
ncbi:MAG: PhnA domain-containing protein [Myxococcales bacterium]|nr:PhnA domain-containing protein [Myxococcales bacterium]